MSARGCWGESQLASVRSEYTLVCATKGNMNDVLAFVHVGGHKIKGRSVGYIIRECVSIILGERHTRSPL